MLNRFVVGRMAMVAAALTLSFAAAAQTEQPKTTAPQAPTATIQVQNPQPGAPPQVAAPAAPQIPPKAVVSEMEFDAGTVNKGDVIKHDFIVENKGKGVLEITRVQPACGCTVTQFDKQVEPGKTGKITASVSTANFSGPIHKTISVATNDTELANFQLAIKATVKAVLNVEPSEFQQFGLVYKGQSLDKEFTIKSEDGTPFEVTQIQCEDPALKYDLKMAPDKKSGVLKVTLPEDHATGPISGRFTLTTTHPKAPTITLSVFGTVRDPLTVYPTEVVYSGLSKAWVDAHPDDVSLNKTITISFEQAPELTITKIHSSLPFIEASQEAITPNQRYTVKLHLKPPVKDGDFAGTVTIETNKKTVTVPVRGKIF